MTTLSRACVECAAPAAASSTLCEPHLRGHTLFVLDRARWPRLRLSDGRQVAGDDAWRPWLRQAKAEELVEVLELLVARPQPAPRALDRTASSSGVCEAFRVH